MKTIINMNIKNILYSTLLIIGFISNLFATAQRPDKIVYNGKEYNLQINPLEVYFHNNPDKRPITNIRSSALWRGYIATFEIRQNELFLNEIKILTSEKDANNEYVWKSVVEEIYPNFKTEKLDWFNGLLILPFGKLVNYVHLDYGSTFENYILLNFQIGALKNVRNLTGEEFEHFKDEKFAQYKKTKEYAEEKSKLIAEEWTQENIDNFLKSFIQSYIARDEN